MSSAQSLQTHGVKAGRGRLQGKQRAELGADVGLQERPQARSSAFSCGRRATMRLLRVGEVARRLGIAELTVRRWCDSGRLPAMRLPPCGKRAGERRVPLSAVDALLEPVNKAVAALHEGPQPMAGQGTQAHRA